MTIEELYTKPDRYDFSRVLNAIIPTQKAINYDVYDAIMGAYPELENLPLTIEELVDYLIGRYTLGYTEVITTYVYKTKDRVEHR